MRFKLCSEFDKIKPAESAVHCIEVNVTAGGEAASDKFDKMSGSNAEQNRAAIGRWLTEKDSGNESEPELSTWEFSKLNISPKPLHTRPSRNSQIKSNTAQQSDINLNTPSPSTHSNTPPSNQSTDGQNIKSSTHTHSGSGFNDIQSVTVSGSDPHVSRGFTRCLRSRVKQNMSSKVGSSEPKPSTSLVKTETINNNSYIAQYKAPLCRKSNSAQYTTTCCDTLIHGTDTLLAMTLTNVPRKTRSRPFDAASLYSVTSDEFNESDDELISINGDSNSEYTHSVRSPRLSSKRKRTTTLSADLEVESLLSPSVDDSLSSCGDSLSVGDYSEPEEIANCEVPRKRLCSNLPISATGNHRPFLDLEKMQDKVEKAASMVNKRKPRAIRIMCFSPIKNISGLSRPATRSQVNSNRELVMSTRFCPLTPVEYTGAV